MSKWRKGGVPGVDVRHLVLLCQRGRLLARHGTARAEHSARQCNIANSAAKPTRPRGNKAFHTCHAQTSKKRNSSRTAAWRGRPCCPPALSAPRRHARARAATPPAAQTCSHSSLHRTRWAGSERKIRSLNVCPTVKNKHGASAASTQPSGQLAEPLGAGAVPDVQAVQNSAFLDRVNLQTD
jgi:hypothetical protein